MYKYINDYELNRKYKNDSDKKTECVMEIGISPTFGCTMYIDFDSKEEKETYKKINEIAVPLIDEIIKISNNALIFGAKLNVEIPDEYVDKFTDAVNYKRKALYLKSLECYKEILEKTGISEMVCKGIYKTLAAAGMVSLGAEFLLVARDIARANNEQNLYFNNEIHIGNLINSSNVEEELMDYLRSLSGNENYVCKMPYIFLKDSILLFVEKYQ